MFVSNRSTRYKGWFEFSEERNEKVKQELKQQPKDYILNVNESEYRTYLFDKFRFEPLQLHEETIEIQPPRQKEHKIDEDDRSRFWRSPFYWEWVVT